MIREAVTVVVYCLPASDVRIGLSRTDSRPTNLLRSLRLESRLNERDFPTETTLGCWTEVAKRTLMPHFVTTDAVDEVPYARS